jgi:hypothetical protein
LTFEVIIERADVQTLVDLAVASLIAVHFECLVLDKRRDTKQQLTTTVGEDW